MLEQETLFPGEEKTETPVQEQTKKKQAKSGKKAAPKRRKKAKREVENYYEILGISRDAASGDIKRSYIEKVKQYPPESYPEEFQQIRRAYDTLRDSALRKEYDIVCEYGESVEDLLREAAGRRITNQTVKLLERAVTIDPEHIKARLMLAYAYISLGKKPYFEAHFNELKHRVGPEQWIKLWIKKIAMLLDIMREDEAFAELQSFHKANPRAIVKYWALYLDVYVAVDSEKQLLQEIENQIRAIEQPAAEDIALYIAWINLTAALEERGKCGKAQAAARKFIGTFKGAEDVALIVAALTNEHHIRCEEKDFAGAKIFIDLALGADKRNVKLRELAQRAQTHMLLEADFFRLCQDERIFPPVLINAMRWYADEFDLPEDFLNDLIEEIPEEFIEHLQGMAEEYAAGIVYLKKKYAALYHHYQQRWEELFKEKTAGLNREARRGLRL